EYRDTVFIGNPVTGIVNHDRLEATGSSFVAIEQPDFITCDDPWFRPVDLKLAPDGSLYILDFYNKIIGHYEVPLKHPGRDRFRGRIWRVVYTGADGQAPPPRKMPDLAKLPTDELIEKLGDANLTVRVLASEELVDRQHPPSAEQLLPADSSDESVWRRAHGLWILERTAKGGLTDEQIGRLGQDASRVVRVHLMKALAERADWTSSQLDLAGLVRGKLDDDDAFVRRAAADALGRHPMSESVEPLLKLWATTPSEDSHLIHVVRMALRDHLLSVGIYAKVAPLAAANADYSTRLADVSLGVHTPEAAEFLFGWLPKGPKTTDQLHEYARETARWLPEAKLPELCVWAEHRGKESLPLARDLALSLYRSAQERKLTLPESYLATATRTGGALLAKSEIWLVQSGIEMAREMRLKPLYERLATLAAPEAKFPDLRAAAIDACVVNDAERSVPLLSQILGSVAEPAALRQKAASALANIDIPRARQELVKHLRLASDRLAIEIAAG
ncbi:MAG TPA: HEAT repeat domain-containing protein, partial [Pirellulales bacterium]|nr:HEAT repeat domain-containing protein [Pirellulales bacterium]